MEVIRVQREDALWGELCEYADNCSWIAGKHLAEMLRKNRLSEWAAVEDGKIAGYCTFLKEDYYPENRYWPWISTSWSIMGAIPIRSI